VFDVDAAMRIAMAKGNIKNVKLSVGKMSFREFSAFCSACQPGGKHESYFLRGVPEHEEKYVTRSGKDLGAGLFRHDSSLLTSDFLVIDADNSECTPKECHDALVFMDYIHFIYTSHSHSEGSNNFRVVIPCDVDAKANMPDTAKSIISDLTKAGVSIKYTGEMGTWSQAWFLPTRDDPDDSLFEHYENMDGTQYDMVKKVTRVKKVTQMTQGVEVVQGSKDDVDSLGSIADVIFNGKEGLHDALRKQIYMMTKDGCNKALVISTVQGMMMGCKDKVDSVRWQSRYDDIPRLCELGSDVSAEEDFIGDVIIGGEEGSDVDMLDWPPGLMGALARSVYMYSDYPNRVISIVTALGLVAGVAGRRFNVNGTGLNLYVTLLMNTGEGKSIIDSFISRTLDEADIFSGAAAFTGARRYTGPKGLMETLHTKRCIVSVFTEAGFMFSSKSGDKAGLTRTILDLYGKSGASEKMQEEVYSDPKNSIPAVSAPCFSMVNESTPDIFLKALRGGTDTGEITRMHIFRVRAETHKLNRDKEYGISPRLGSKIKNLMSRCNATQRDDNPDASEFVVTEDMWDFTDSCKKESHACLEEDPIRSRMLSRSGLKAWKVACLCSVLNNSAEKGARKLHIGEKEWEWAKSLHKFEMDGIEEFFEAGGDDDMYHVIKNIVLPKVVKVLCNDLNKGYASRALQLTRVDRKKSRLPRSMLRKLLKSSKGAREATGAYGKSGVDAIVEYMIENKWIGIDFIGNLNSGVTEYIVLKERIRNEFRDLF